MGNVVSGKHQSTARVTKAMRMARNAKTKAMPRKSGRRNNAHLGDADFPRPQKSCARTQLRNPSDEAGEPRHGASIGRRHAPWQEEANNKTEISDDLQLRNRFDQGEMPARIFEHHGFMHHRKLEMRCGLSTGYARILRESNDHEGDKREGERGRVSLAAWK